MLVTCLRNHKAKRSSLRYMPVIAAHIIHRKCGFSTFCSLCIGFSKILRCDSEKDALNVLLPGSTFLLILDALLLGVRLRTEEKDLFLQTSLTPLAYSTECMTCVFEADVVVAMGKNSFSAKRF